MNNLYDYINCSFLQKTVTRIVKFTILVISILIIQFTELIAQDSTGTFTDKRDKRVYKWVKIGNQVWMAENLAYLPVIKPYDMHTHWNRNFSARMSTHFFYSVYGYNGKRVKIAKATTNYQTYGVLYNWFAAMKGKQPSNDNPSGVRGICPAGWHLPSNKEWRELQKYLDDPDSDIYDSGTKLKSDSLWNGTNSSGFSALPAGVRSTEGKYYSIGYVTDFWSTTDSYAYTACTWMLSTPNKGLFEFNDISDKYYFISVRCLKD